MGSPCGRTLFEEGPMKSMTVKIMLTCFVVFVLQTIPGIGSMLNDWGCLVPARAYHGEAWRFLTTVFLHGSVMHIVFNMLILWFFGAVLEDMWGVRKFLTFYLVCGVGAGLLCFPLWNDHIVGASGEIGRAHV